MTVDRPESAFAKVVRLSGGQSAYGRTHGRSQQAVSDRLKRGDLIWAEDVILAETTTGVSREEQRPDLYPRESAAPDRDAA